MPTSKKKVIIALAAVVLVIIAFFAVLAPNNDPTDIANNPLVDEYYPDTSNNEDGPIVIKAIEPVDENSGQFKITPEVAGDIQTIDEFIIFWPDRNDKFIDGTKYTAIFEEHRTVSGQELGAIELRFVGDSTIEYAPLQSEVVWRYGRSDPFLSALPYIEPTVFSVSQLDRDQVSGPPYDLSIKILTIQGRNETIESFNTNAEAAKQSALQWIRSQGVDPESEASIFYPTSDQGNFTGDSEVPVSATP